MKNIMITLVVSIFVIVGILLSLIAIYAVPDEQVHFTEAGYLPRPKAPAWGCL